MSRESYKVITKDGIGEIVEKKSRFIGAVYNVESTEEAEAKIAEISKKYWDARHNCYAYVIGGNSEISKCSDNGEPSGTAGKPFRWISVLLIHIHFPQILIGRLYILPVDVERTVYGAWLVVQRMRESQS